MNNLLPAECLVHKNLFSKILCNRFEQKRDFKLPEKISGLRFCDDHQKNANNYNKNQSETFSRIRKIRLGSTTSERKNYLERSHHLATEI